MRNEQVELSRIDGGFTFTHTGGRLSLIDMSKNIGAIKIVDIAHALSNNIRWNGVTSIRYSVAQHSLLVRKLIAELPWGLTGRELVKAELIGISHDFAEAYLSDIPTPIKDKLPEYKKLEFQMEKLIANEIGLKTTTKEIEKIAQVVAMADKLSMLIEACTIVSGDADFNKEVRTKLANNYSHVGGLQIPFTYGKFVREENPQMVKARLMKETYELVEFFKCGESLFEGIDVEMLDTDWDLTLFDGTEATHMTLSNGETTTIIDLESEVTVEVANKILDSLMNINRAFLI